MLISQAQAASYQNTKYEILIVVMSGLTLIFDLPQHMCLYELQDNTENSSWLMKGCTARTLTLWTVDCSAQ